jgi:dsDNA-specific endonuclease/ATPase MutS2
MRQTQANIHNAARMLSDPGVHTPARRLCHCSRRSLLLPVKAEARSRVPGIVHDRSGAVARFSWSRKPSWK